jgi:NAD(P)-dependent dehydrogenase (short-subunit alcohol dehydrogenase family)
MRTPKYEYYYLAQHHQIITAIIVTMMSAPARHALVVGGTSGIGQGIALALARRGDIQVTIAGRSEQRGAEIVQQLSALSSAPKDKDGHPQQQQQQQQQYQLQHQFLSINAFDLESVKELANKHSNISKNNEHKVDLLVMTQGMATLQGYTPTVNDGIDEKLQLHVFSRFYLAKLLAPHMKEESRILTVLSAGVHGKYQHVETDFELQQNYSIQNAADAAGYYTDALFQQLQEQHPTLTIAHAAPGFVNTNWGTEMPWILRKLFLRPLQSLFGKSLEQCGETLTKAWLDDIPEHRYSLIDEQGQIININSKVDGSMKHTPEERDIIWNKTMLLLPPDV